ncbi:uncharacterized protein SETTUDRAFT_163906 [Exserohilum turcica Et28A]|uniref:Uncharacterized protein n=1 Tax=Exserohilum turcicum (strain 28A) TaxID=671987 RepID=R0KAH2_EXST2|nr:uncharacterized protein SETTUDRAFT_163906 [Exserohilum turcica Et28A]EOA85217.1 hypothetical protein SETTUDRAFT_163906 [Exserohilum turcica Et28A]
MTIWRTVTVEKHSSRHGQKMASRPRGWGRRYYLVWGEHRRRMPKSLNIMEMETCLGGLAEADSGGRGPRTDTRAHVKGDDSKLQKQAGLDFETAVRC